jgi:predicted PurR-regulated permease PerM
MILLLAWLISIAMEPAVKWFENHGYRRGLGAGLVILGLVIFLIAFLGTLGGMLFSQLSAAVESAPAVVTTIVDWLNTNFDAKLNPNEIVSALKLDSSSLTPIVTNLAGGLLGVVSSLFTFLFDFLTILVFAFYLSAEGPKVKRGIASWLKPNRQHIFLTVWDIAVSKTGGFVVSRVVLALLSAVAHVVFFWAIGVPYWLPMGLFAGITAQFIPTIGTYLGIAVPVLFTLSADIYDALWIIGFATIYQQIENYILTPKVSRATMDMHPAVALAAVIIGAAVFGPIGAFIGIPIVAGIIAVVDTYGHRFELIPDLAVDDYSEGE